VFDLHRLAPLRWPTGQLANWFAGKKSNALRLQAHVICTPLRWATGQLANWRTGKSSKIVLSHTRVIRNSFCIQSRICLFFVSLFFVSLFFVDLTN
jgi:hypothetical protein